MICQQCKGLGRVEIKMRDLAGREPHGCGIIGIAPCDQPACSDGKVNMAEYYASWGLPTTG